MLCSGKKSKRDTFILILCNVVSASLESPEPPVVLGDVAVTGQGVGCGPVILDADVPSLCALHLSGESVGVSVYVRCENYLVKLRHIRTVHPHEALQVRGRAGPLCREESEDKHL